jgi:type IV pilus assembly protein PilW
MVAMTLGLLLTAAAVSLFLSVRQLQIEQERVATMKENLRFATDFMARDIRGAGLREDGELDPPVHWSRRTMPAPSSSSSPCARQA